MLWRTLPHRGAQEHGWHAGQQVTHSDHITVFLLWWEGSQEHKVSLTEPGLCCTHPSERSFWTKNRHILARQQLEMVCIPLVWCLDKCLLLDFGVMYNPAMATN